MNSRQCHDCGRSMDRYVPRKQIDGKMLCPACVATPRGGLVSAQPWTASRMEQGMSKAPIDKVAHDSGDQFRVFHCPFCGSGQLTSRSDGGAECAFCGAVFTVRVQPAYPAMPQTQDGAPVNVPGVPDADPAQGVQQGGAPMGSVPFDEGDPMDPDALPDEDEEDPGQEGPPAEDGGNPFAKGSSLKTSTGAILDRENYARYLALKAANRAPETLAAVRDSRG